jgi:hypothetical protein
MLLIKINTSIVLFFFRKPNETGQPLYDAMKKLKAGKYASRLL